MIEQDRIKSVVVEYEKSQVITEQEVRSKFLVPLIEALGYKSELRAEEFPVFGFEGKKKLPVKKADFILFSKKEYNSHRCFKQEDIEWVQNHSLLVVEAKRPGELAEVDGQAQFYTMWTRTPAYIVSDGIEIRGYYHTVGCADINSFSCKIDEIDLWIDKIICFSVDLLQKVKNVTREFYYNLLVKGEYIRSNLFIYKDTYVEKLREKQSLLELTKFKIKEKYNAKIYLDDDVAPIFEGCLYTHLKKDRVIMFQSDLLDYYIDFELFFFPIYNYHVLNKSVEQRIRGLSKVKKFFSAKKMRIVSDNFDDIDYIFTFPLPNEEKQVLDFWIEELGKLKEIEDYYSIRFELQWINDLDELRRTYIAIDEIYCGIIMQNNCYRIMAIDEQPPDVEDFYDPFTLEEGNIKLDEINIHNICFKPYRISLIPNNNKVDYIYEEGILCLPCCCTFIVES